MKYCKKCGKQMRDEDLFCNNCGTKAEPATQAEDKNADVLTAENTEEKAEKQVTEETQKPAEAQQKAENKEQTADVETQQSAETVQASVQETQKTDKAVQPDAQNVSTTSQEANQQPVKMQGQDERKVNPAGAQTFINKLGKNKIIGIAAAAVVVLVVAVAMILNMKKKVNINDYITVKFTGYDTVGQAKCELDEDALVMAILKAQGKKVTESDLNSLSSLSSAFQVMVKVENDAYLNYQLSQTSDLSNGDKVTLKITCSKELEKSLGINLVSKDKEYTVSDLDAATQIDPFDYLNVTFSGTSPNASVSLKNTADSSDSFLKNLYFSADKSSGISAGDTITVKVSANKEDALKKGYILTETSKEYTCDKVDEYVTDITDIPEDKMTALKKDATDKIESAFAEIDSKNGVTCGELTFEGTYVLNPKTTSYYSNDNTVYVVFSANVSATGSGDVFSQSFAETKVYFPVCMQRVLLKADGTVSHDSYLTIKGSTDLSYGWSNLFGYTDGAKMYKEIITTVKDRYTYQVDGNITEFGK